MTAFGQDAAPVVELEGVGKWYRDRGYRAWFIHDVYRALTRQSKPAIRRRALDDITLTVARGESVGVIGANGAGKSTLLKLIAGISRPSCGVVRTTGRISTQLGIGLGFNPLLTGRENMFLEGTLLGLTNRGVRLRMNEMISFAGLEDAIDQPVWTYSSGMVARLGFSVATQVEFETLLLDEALSAGDAWFRERCNRTLERFRADGRTLIIVSHGMDSVRELCDRVIWLDEGRIREEGRTDEVVEHYEQESTSADDPANFDDD